MVTNFLQTINYYLDQSGADWLNLGQAAGDNLVVIWMLIISCAVLSLSFYIVDILMIIAVFQKGFFSNEHRVLGIWFLVFLFLVGTCFSFQIVILFFAIYWIYAGLLCVTSFSALLTVVLYLKYFSKLSAIPSGKEITELQQENKELNKKINALHEHLDVWSQNVGYHINLLKAKHHELSHEVHISAPSEISNITSEVGYEETKEKVLSSLTKIKEELTALTEAIK